jgi:hypothetical protein
VHGIGVYSVRVGPKSPALERFPDIKKKKNYCICFASSIDGNNWSIFPFNGLCAAIK